MKNWWLSIFIFLFPGLTQECIDLSFWFKHETTPLNNKQVHSITVLSVPTFNTEISDTKFMYSAIEWQHACAYRASIHYHAHKAWLCARNVMVQSRSVSLTELLANHIVSVVHQWRQPMLGTDDTVGWAHTVSRVSQEPRMGYSYDREIQYIHCSVRAPLSRATLVMIGLSGCRSHTTIYQCCLSHAKLAF